MEPENVFVKELIDDLESGHLQLPTLPEVALRVRDVVDDEDANANQISQIIAQDAALSARLLQVANSPLYRGRNEIDRLDMVVSRLGSKLVRNLVTSQVMKQMFQATHDAVDRHLRAVWEHSVQVAAISRVLVGQCAGISPDQAMLAGLLHDIGTLPILYRAEERSELLDNPGLLDHLVTTLHTRVGGAILRHWQFPEALVAVAEQHEDLTRVHEGPADLVDVVQVANLQSHMGTEHNLANTDWTQVAAFHQLGLDIDVDEIELTDRIEEINEVQELFV
ncbi:putative nucleotidyltransferase with HDIG domain [Thiogranum longum]|uniref:Putative nucleotidyltransferase with HDIG domain n=1 Tax=Thiogranum longum TaxID=1537524 RepID=A0A4R1HCV3_9GAMM|nr:HDOD domain-containing protein [Thiogranum longum]TCK18403.1 putative nucleotidyltransferase with HDIG domain [Thiogranum longum]